MAQLSVPYRIALAALCLLAAVWFVALRPGLAVEEPVEPLPGEGAAAQVAEAQGAAATSDARNAATAGAPATATGGAPAAATGGTAAPAEGATAAAGTPAPAAKPAPARPAPRPKAPTDPSSALLAHLDAGRAAVLLFSDGRGADDREVRGVVDGLDRRGGRVVVRRARMAAVGRYEAITRGVVVAASPTVVVLGPARDARALPGLVTAGELRDVVADALDVSDDPVAAAKVARAAGVRRAKAACDGDAACTTHFTAANDACVAAVTSAMAGAAAGAASGGTLLAAQQGARAGAAALAASFAAVPAPPALQARHARATKLLRGQLASFDRALKGTRDGATVARRLRRDRSLTRSDRRLRALGYPACG